MAKGHADHQHQDQQGTPTYIIMSVLFAIVIFAFEGIKDTLSLGGVDSQTRSTGLGFIVLGLSICFFWRRLHDSLFKSLTAFFFTASLWAYFVATVALPLLVGGDDVASRLQLIHQCGLGGVVIAGFSLMAALLYHQKPVPALLMTTFAGFMVAFGSLYPLLRSGAMSGSNDYSENRGGHGSKKVEIVSESGEEAHGHGKVSEEHGAHDEHGEAKISHEESGHGSKDEHASEKKPKMKLSARDAEKSHGAAEEEDDESESRIHRALHEDDGDDEEATLEDAEEHAPRTLSKAQKAKLEKTPARPAKARAVKTAHGKPAASKHKVLALAAKEAPHGPHWEYSGEHGPEHWGDIGEAFKACSTGTEQSPINILPNWPTQSVIELDYKPSTFQVLDNGHTVQVNVEKGSYATIAGQRYELKQFHFHTPSEHLIENRSYQMEVHFVHANDKGQLAVIGAFINPGRLHNEYQKVWEYMPVKANEPIKPYNRTLDLRSMLPENLQAFRYAGSLTTPPCSEKVNWNVLFGTLRFSQDQIDRFKSKYQMNARPVQPLNYRKAN